MLRAARLALAGAYLVAKRIVSPPLYLARRFGYSGSWPERLDAALNRTCLPLTERPDNEVRLDVEPKLAVGDPVPDVPVTFPDGSRRSVLSSTRPPVLVVLARGSWCSYSRLHLADLEAASSRFSAAGVSLLVVTNRADAAWWHSRQVRIPLASDPDGSLFGAMGVRVDSWIEIAWGRIIPHESAFFFDSDGRLAAADVRRVSSTRPGQSFLSAERWLKIAAQYGRAGRESP